MNEDQCPITLAHLVHVEYAIFCVKSTYSPDTVSRSVGGLGTWFLKFPDLVALCCFGTWSGHVARILIEDLAGEDYYYVSVVDHYF